MLTTTRWTPWNELAGLHRDLDTIFNRVFGEGGVRQMSDTFTPPADLRREGDRWLLSMALPGISPDKVEIDIVGRTLRVRGERAPEVSPNAEAVVSEISYGRFERLISLPVDIDAEHVEASYRHGMLELVMPVSEAAKPRRIQVAETTEARQLKAA